MCQHTRGLSPRGHYVFTRGRHHNDGAIERSHTSPGETAAANQPCAVRVLRQAWWLGRCAAVVNRSFGVGAGRRRGSGGALRGMRPRSRVERGIKGMGMHVSGRGGVRHPGTAPEPLHRGRWPWLLRNDAKERTKATGHCAFPARAAAAVSPRRLLLQAIP